MKNLLILLFFVPVFAKAQTNHTVAPKENWYSVARKYNVPPKELAAFNNTSIETGLTIGQVIKIPAKGKNTTAKTEAVVAKSAPKKTEPARSKSEPVYHKVEKKETLYHISKKYGEPIDSIKKWNHLTSDAVSEGTNLLVTYASIGVMAVSEDNRNGQKVEISEENKNKFQKDETASTKKTEPAKTVVVPDKVVVVTETKPTQVKTIEQPKTIEPAKTEANKITGKNFNGGYFKSLYNEQAAVGKNAKEETGTAAIFKSASGWEDGKYYCLHNNAQAGSIIKITNKANQKVVYAKVLDVIPDLRQNTGIMIRLSNAAADELGAGESNFEAVLNY